MTKKIIVGVKTFPGYFRAHIKLFSWAIFIMIGLLGCESSSDVSSQTEATAGSETTAQTQCELKMGFDAWEPYQFETAGGVINGVDVELVGILAKHQACELIFVKGQWVDLLRMLRNGEVDILAGATVVAERESYAWFSEPYRMEQFELYVSPDAEFELSNVETLLSSSARLGLTDGYIYGEQVSAAQRLAGDSGRFVYASIAEVNFTNLSDGRIDGFLEDPFVAAAIMRKRGWQNQVRATGIMAGASPVSLMFSRETINKEQLQAFNKSLGEIKTNGEQQEVFKRYLGVEN